MKASMVILAALIAVVCVAVSVVSATSIALSRELTPPAENDTSVWTKHPSKSSSSTISPEKSTKDSYEPIDDDESSTKLSERKSTTSTESSKPKKSGDSNFGLDVIPESDDEQERFEESAQSYYPGYGGAYGGYNRYPYRPSYGYRRPYNYNPYRNTQYRGWGR